MKTILRWTVTVAVAMALTTNAHAWRRNWSQSIANETGLAYNKNYTLDMSILNLKTVGAQAVYSTTSFNTSSFTDGTASTETITVVSTTSLVGAAGTDRITVVNNTLGTNVKITFNGYDLWSGGDWAKGIVSSNTAVSIAGAFNTHAQYFGVTAATTSAGVVTVTCASVGSQCNANTLTVNTSSLTVLTSRFTGGRDNAVLCINGNCLAQGSVWYATGTVTTAAGSIARAINADSTLSTVVVSTNVLGVIYATSTVVGLTANYSVISSTYSALTPNKPAFQGGTNSAVVTTAGELFIAAHGYTRALPLLYTKSAGTSPQDLSANTTYYVVPVDTNNFKLATTQAKAIAGTADVRLSTQTATGGGSFSLAPLTFTGTPILAWYASNDCVNYNAVSGASVTWGSPSSTVASNVWDFGNVSYRCLQLQVTGPTTGGMALQVLINGQN